MNTRTHAHTHLIRERRHVKQTPQLQREERTRLHAQHAHVVRIDVENWQWQTTIRGSEGEGSEHGVTITDKGLVRHAKVPHSFEKRE